MPSRNWSKGPSVACLLAFTLFCLLLSLSSLISLLRLVRFLSTVMLSSYLALVAFIAQASAHGTVLGLVSGGTLYPVCRPCCQRATKLNLQQAWGGSDPYVSPEPKRIGRKTGGNGPMLDVDALSIQVNFRCTFRYKLCLISLIVQRERMVDSTNYFCQRTCCSCCTCKSRRRYHSQLVRKLAAVRHFAIFKGPLS